MQQVKMKVNNKSRLQPETWVQGLLQSVRGPNLNYILGFEPLSQTSPKNLRADLVVTQTVQ